MLEFYVELNSSAWVGPITEQITNRSPAPIYIDNSIVDYQRLYADTKDSVAIAEGDFKRFDSRLYLNFIMCAVSIAKCFYQLDGAQISNFKNI